MNRLATYIVSGLMAVAAASCSDDRLWNADDIIGNGEATISATVGFKTFEPALEKSRTPGNTLDGIDNITILAYDNTGERLIASKVYTSADLTFTESTQKPADGVDVDNTVPTQKTTLEDFNLSYGRYKVYVVANADLSGKDVSSEAKLKAITFDWQSDISKNNQMFGWFEAKVPGAISGNGLDAPVITINQSSVTLNAWLVRLGSKVTVSYDATNLNENIYIFLKSVQIKDIPVSCALGERNTPSESSELIADGEKILYYEGAEPDRSDFNPSIYPATLTRGGRNKFGSDHSHNADALFFYENDQGKGKNKGQDVVDNSTTGQTPGGGFNPGSGSSDGKIDFPDGNSDAENTGFKDEKRYGTYIEVKAYYRSDNEERLGEGDITYRFMLGKNITDSYEALRNYHYKLTLKFNKFANDVDWHIEYTPDPELYIPNPYYISYIYDKTMNLPIQIVGEIEPGTKVEAKIIENDWMPYNYEHNPPEYAPKDQYYSPGKVNYDYTQETWNGFLSLVNTGHTVSIGGDIKDASQANSTNKEYWERKLDDQGTSRGLRLYDTTEGSHPNATLGDYNVSSSNDTTIVSIPLYTRAKNLVKASGYTGNNPYVSYQRQAKIQVTASLKDPDGVYRERKKTVQVIQVRRVVNPKGVWRAHDESNQFLVHLTRLETEFTTNPWNAPESRQFKTFTSNGPWSAEVLVEGGYNTTTNTTEAANGWIKLSTADGTTRLSGNVIYGETGSEIKFYYEPNGVISKDRVRYGIIKVRYHNYTCEHLVFVRQGYAPIPVATDPNSTKWYSFNLVTGTEMATSPLDEGSLFKRFDFTHPIRAVNNITYPFKEQITFDNKVAWGSDKTKNKPLVIDYEYIKDKFFGIRYWNQWSTPSSAVKFDEVVLNDQTKAKVASVDDYLQLYNDPNVQYGFGVCYDGTASGIQTSLREAYSYYAPYTPSSKAKDQGVTASIPMEQSQGRGMRGCFVYNERTGAQIFLPAGAAGYGRRKETFSADKTSWYTDVASPGMLIYANRNDFMAQTSADVPWYRPLLWDLYRRPGACYWCNETKPGNAIQGNADSNNSVGWDFNYITFDFFPISRSNVVIDPNGDNGYSYQSGKIPTDALRIRCVVPPSD